MEERGQGKTQIQPLPYRPSSTVEKSIRQLHPVHGHPKSYCNLYGLHSNEPAPLLFATRLLGAERSRSLTRGKVMSA